MMGKPIEDLLSVKIKRVHVSWKRCIFIKAKPVMKRRSRLTCLVEVSRFFRSQIGQVIPIIKN